MRITILSPDYEVKHQFDVHLINTTITGEKVYTCTAKDLYGDVITDWNNKVQSFYLTESNGLLTYPSTITGNEFHTYNFSIQ